MSGSLEYNFIPSTTQNHHNHTTHKQLSSTSFAFCTDILSLVDLAIEGNTVIYESYFFAMQFPYLALGTFIWNYSDYFCAFRTIIGFLTPQIFCHLKLSLKPFSHEHTKTSSLMVFNNISQQPSMTSRDTDSPDYYLESYITQPLSIIGHARQLPTPRFYSVSWNCFMYGSFHFVFSPLWFLFSGIFSLRLLFHMRMHPTPNAVLFCKACTSW